MKKSKKLIGVFDGAYRLILASLIFWKNLFLGGVVYGWVRAIEATLVYLKKLAPHALGNPKRHRLPYEKGISFLITLNVCCLGAGFIGLQTKSSTLFLFLAVIGVTLSCLLLPFTFHYLYLNRAEPQKAGLNLIYEAELALFSKPVLTFFVISLVVLAGLAFYFNAIIFFFVIPGVAMELIGRAFDKVLKISGEEQLHD